MKNHKEIISIIIAAALMSSCAKTMYVKPGISQAQVDQDNADCQYDVVKHTPTYDGVGDPIAAGWAQAERKQAILAACYQAKGYHLQTQQEAKGLTDQQQSISDRYKQAMTKWQEKAKPISEYIINVCRPKDDKGYIDCIKEKRPEMISISLFPDMEANTLNEFKEFDEQLLRKEITREKFKELVTKVEENRNKLVIERGDKDIKNGIYTGNSKY